MISSVEKPLNSAPIGQIGKPLHGSKSDSLGNPLGEGQVIGSDGYVLRGSSTNYIRLSIHHDFVIDGTTYDESNFGWYAYLIFRGKDASSDWNYFVFGFEINTLSLIHI